MNFLKTVFLLGVLTVMVVLLGQAVGGQQGAAIAFGVALAMNFVGYWWSDTIVMKLHGAREVSEDEAPGLHAMVERLSHRAGIPKPRVCVMEDPSPNAFATGRGPSRAAVCVTTGIVRALDEHELEGVLAHELGHVRNRDVLIATVAAALAGAITLIADWMRWGLMFGGVGGSSRDDDEGAGSGLGVVGALVALIVAPIAALLVQMAISRAREFEADATGARLAGTPDGLASALAKIDTYARPLRTATGGTAHLFIANPFNGLGGITSLFATHPPVPERIARLRALRHEVAAY